MSLADPFPELVVRAGRIYASAVVMTTLQKEFSSDNGSVYRPNFHVVCEKRITIKAGSEVRCMDGENVRGQGEVYAVKNTNYFNYSELWM